MTIQNIIKNICEKYDLKWFLNNQLYIKYWIWEQEREEWDFFYFVYEEYENFIEKKSDSYNEIILELWKKEIDWKKLEDLKQFDKNINLFIFLKLDNARNYNDELIKKISSIEEDPYYANKFVITYTEDQIESITDVVEELKQENLNNCLDSLEKQEKNTKQFNKENFILDLVSCLYFLRIELDLEIDSKLDIYNNSYNKLNKKEKINEDVYDKIDKYWNLEILENKNIEIYTEKISDFEEKLFELWNDIIKDSTLKVEGTFDNFKTNQEKNG